MTVIPIELAIWYSEFLYLNGTVEVHHDTLG